MSKHTSLIENMAFPIAEETSSFEASSIEYEIEAYLTGFDIEQIKSMAISKEGQEQWGIYVPKSEANASSGSLRVRSTAVGYDDPVYEYCCKTDQKDKGKLETEFETTKVHFEQFKLMADQGLVKTRYRIPGELESGIKLVWEFDVFYNKKGELVPWVKVDAEFTDAKPEGLKPSDIPVVFADCIIITPEDKAKGRSDVSDKIAELYEKYFRTGNVYV